MTFIQSNACISSVEMTFSMVIQYTEPVSDGPVCELHKSDVPEYTKLLQNVENIVRVENIVGVIVLLTDVCLLLINQDYLFYYTTGGYDAY